MHKIVILFLRIITIFLWVFTTAFGSLLFYNFHAVGVDWNYNYKPILNEYGNETIGIQLNLTLTFTYTGMYLPMKIFAAVRLVDKNGTVLDQGNFTIRLESGDRATRTISLLGPPNILGLYLEVETDYSEYLGDIALVSLKTTSNYEITGGS